MPGVCAPVCPGSALMSSVTPFSSTAPFSFLPVRPAAPASCTGGTWGTRARLGREGMERAHGARGAGWAGRPLPRRSRDPGGDEPGRLLHWATDAQVTESSAGSVEAQSCGFRSVGVHGCAQVMQVCSGVLVYVPVCSRDSHGSGVHRCAQVCSEKLQGQQQPRSEEGQEALPGSETQPPPRDWPPSGAERSSGKT